MPVARLEPVSCRDVSHVGRMSYGKLLIAVLVAIDNPTSSQA